MTQTFPAALADKYSPIQLVGSGGFAHVYKVANRLLEGRTEALKVMRHDLVEMDPHAADRFLQEAGTAATLVHPNIIIVYDVGRTHEDLYFSMEFVEGESLESRLRRSPEGLSRAEVRKLCGEIGRALDYAHARGCVHRDVKPANILYDQNTGRFILTDFGIAMRSGVPRKTQEGIFIGTIEYASPEQLEVRDSIGPFSDQYSFAMVLYECLTGHSPYSTERGESKQVLAHLTKPLPPHPSIPSDLFRVLQKAASKRPEDRYPSMGALQLAMDRTLAASQAKEIPPPVSSAVEGVPAILLPVVAAIVVLVGLLLLGGAWILFHADKAPAPTPQAVSATPPGNQEDGYPPPQGSDEEIAEWMREHKAQVIKCKEHYKQSPYWNIYLSVMAESE
jgi:serine/threonine-protein kinase